jgi:hypothetical protein
VFTSKEKLSEHKMISFHLVKNNIQQLPMAQFGSLIMKFFCKKNASEANLVIASA